MRKLNMPRRLSSSAARTHGGNMLFMLPTIILFCIVVLIPFFQGIPYSFTNWKSIVSETKEFNGLKNYIYLIKIFSGFPAGHLQVHDPVYDLRERYGIAAGAGHPQVFLVQ
jgi:ABC-type sugar transport system permease subunit